MLLVEDSSESLNAMGDLLALYGARSSTSTSAADALQAATIEDFNVIVTDPSLPITAGYQLVQQLRKLRRCSTMHINALTRRPLAQVEVSARSPDVMRV